LLPGERTELKFLSIYLLLVLLCGWLFNQLTLFLLIFFIVYLCWHARSFWLLYKWVNKDMKKSAPELKGLWRELAVILAKKNQQQIKSVKSMRKAVKRTSQLTHAIDEGIVVLKKDFSLDWWNATAKLHLGLYASDRGHPITSLIREPELLAYLKQKKIKRKD